MKLGHRYINLFRIRVIPEARSGVDIFYLKKNKITQIQ